MQTFRISNTETAGQIEQFEAPFCQLNCGVCEINTGVFRPSLGKLSTISSQSTAHFQHAQVFRLCKPRGRWNVPLLFITMLFYEFIKPARARWCIGKLGPAGVLLPEGTDTLLEYGVVLRHLENGRITVEEHALQRSPFVHDIDRTFIVTTLPCASRPALLGEAAHEAQGSATSLG